MHENKRLIKYNNKVYEKTIIIANMLWSVAN